MIPSGKNKGEMSAEQFVGQYFFKYLPQSGKVKLKDGESPVKANGKLYVIDGGISKAYRTKTGIAGYTLIFNSHHIALAEHTIDSKDRVLAGQGSYINYKVSPVMKITERMKERVRVADTDVGTMLKERVKDLKMLVKAYEDGEF